MFLDEFRLTHSVRRKYGCFFSLNFFMTLEADKGMYVEMADSVGSKSTFLPSHYTRCAYVGWGQMR